MLDGYIYYVAWISLVCHALASLIPGPGSQSNQTTRVLSALIALPILGRLIGWW